MISYAQKVASILISIVIVCLSGVLFLPVFADHRAGLAECSWSICLAVVGSLVLVSVNAQSGSRENEHNILGYFFFAGVLLLNCWFFSADIKFFIYEIEGCRSYLIFACRFTKFVFASLLLVTIITQSTSCSIPAWKKFAILISGAISFSYAIGSVIDEVLWNYIEVVEMSIHHPDYGFDLNVTNLEEGVPQALRHRARCLEHMPLHKTANYILELIPFSVEFFSLGACFCFVVWRTDSPHDSNHVSTKHVATQAGDSTMATTELDVDAVKQEKHKEEENFERSQAREENVKVVDVQEKTGEKAPLIEGSSTSYGSATADIEVVVQQSPDSINVDKTDVEFNDETAIHYCNTDCVTSISPPVAVVLMLIVAIPTVWSIVTFWVIMEKDYHNAPSAILIFIVQQICYQILLLSIEGFFHWRHLRHVPALPNAPRQYQLDVVLLIFPVLFLGILMIVRCLPDFMQIDEASHPFIFNRFVILNISTAVLNWVQVSYQAIFLSAVFCRMYHSGIYNGRWLFLVIGVINFCVWLSWTFECKLITIHGRSYKIYGITNWIVIVYSTVPFILFCYIHSASCCLEVFNHLRHSFSLEHATSQLGHNPH